MFYILLYHLLQKNNYIYTIEEITQRNKKKETLEMKGSTRHA